MRKPKRLAVLLLVAVMSGMAALPAPAAEDAPPAAETTEAADATAQESADNPAGGLIQEMTDLAVGQLVYIGDVSTRVEDQWECETSFAVATAVEKKYETMAGNVLRLTLYSTIPQDDASAFYLPQDSHISYVDGNDRFTMTGRRGAYYCYQKAVRVTSGGVFDLTVANTNAALYSGLYDTITIHAFDTIEALDFFAEQSVTDSAVSNFFVTANNSDTALITPDTVGFNATDNEWKVITSDKSERVLFENTSCDGYTFDPGTIALSITSSKQVMDNPVTIQVYYLGLINGRLFTVGPYAYPASAATYSSSFELERTTIDVLATENKMTFTGLIESGRKPSITVTDAEGKTALQSVEVTETNVDGSGKDRVAVMLSFSDTSKDLDLLVGNRWSASRIAYNYRTLHVSFLQQITSVALTAQQKDHYRVSYAVTVNGQRDLDTTAVNWYVNDTLQAEHGMTMERSYTEGGNYDVYAELGGVQSNKVSSQIIYTDAQAGFWYVAMLVMLVIAVLALWNKSRSSGSQLDVQLRRSLLDLQREAETLQLQLNRKNTTPHHAAQLMRRRVYTIKRMSDSLLMQYEKTNMALYQNACNALDGVVRTVLRPGCGNTDDLYYTRALLSGYRSGLSKALAAMDEVVRLDLQH